MLCFNFYAVLWSENWCLNMAVRYFGSFPKMRLLRMIMINGYCAVNMKWGISFFSIVQIPFKISTNYYLLFFCNLQKSSVFMVTHAIACHCVHELMIVSHRRKLKSIFPHVVTLKLFQIYLFLSISRSRNFWNLLTLVQAHFSIFDFSSSSFYDMYCIGSRDMCSSRDIFLPLLCWFHSISFYTFQTTGVVTVFFVHFLCVDAMRSEIYLFTFKR